ncbi:MAG: M28 family peptidase, partial [Acidobacteriota bacterium]
GAEAFVSEHPWAKEVRLALNVEARGTSGPAQMFETGAGNGLIVREWAAAVPHPTGSSLTYEVYKRMPNDTDFSVFKRLNLTGLNFAFVGNWEAYHTPLDSVSNLDRGSLQHHGLAALALVRRFGALDLATIRDRDAIYFGIPIIGMAVRYSSFWAWPLAAGALLLWLWITIRARRAHHTSIGGLILAFLVFVILAGAAGFWGFRFSRVVDRVHHGWLPAGNVLTSGPYAGALVASVATVWLALYVLLRKKFKPHTLALGVAGVSAVLTAVATQAIAGGSYVLLWPVAGSVLAAAVLPEASGTRAAYAARTLLVCALGLPAVLILWPLAADLFATLGVSPEGGAAMAA